MFSKEEPVAPTADHLRALRNAEARRYELDGFTNERDGVRAVFECIMHGWLSRGRLTAEGRAVLALDKAVEGHVEIKVIKDAPARRTLLLPPSSLFDHPKDDD